MALQKCKDCKADVSADAAICSVCGAKLRTPIWTILASFITVVAAIVTIFLAFVPRTVRTEQSAPGGAQRLDRDAGGASLPPQHPERPSTAGSESATPRDVTGRRPRNAARDTKSTAISADNVPTSARIEQPMPDVQQTVSGNGNVQVLGSGNTTTNSLR